MAVSSIAYQATIIGDPPPGGDWYNDTGADCEIGTVVKSGNVIGVLVGGNSQDGSTKVLSTNRGVIATRPGMRVLAPAFTTDSWATGSLLYWDNAALRYTSTAVSAAGGYKIGQACNSKAAGVSTAIAFFNQTPVV